MKILKNILAAVIILGLVAWGGITLVNNKMKSEEETAIVAKENDKIAVNTSTVAYEQIDTEYIANGTFEALQEVTYTTEAPGQVIQLLVKEGDRVSVGQVMAVIKGDAQSVDLSRSESTYQTALTSKERMENALKSGGVTQQQLDMAVQQLNDAKAQLDVARLRVGDTRVKSTMNGIVNQRMVEKGTFVSPGMPMFEVVDVSGLKLKVEVSENQVANYSEGNPIKVKASVYPDKEFDGKITFIAPKASSSLNFPVEIKVENPQDSGLRAGMYGTAVFTVDENKANPKALVVPRKAFVGGLNSGEIFVVNGDKAELIKVSTGRNFGDRIEILSGLKEGQEVVTSGQINLTAGAVIQIMN